MAEKVGEGYIEVSVRVDNNSIRNRFMRLGRDSGDRFGVQFSQGVRRTTDRDLNRVSNNLNRIWARTGNDLSRHISSGVSRGIGNKRIETDTDRFSRRFGGSFMRAFDAAISFLPGRLEHLFSGRAGPVGSAFGIIFMSSMLGVVTILGAQLGGALIAGFSAAPLIGAIIAVAQDVRIKTAFTEAANRWLSGFRDASRAVIPEVINAIRIIDAYIKQAMPHIKNAIRQLAPAISAIAAGVGVFIREISRGIEKLAPVGRKFLQAFAEWLPRLAREFNILFSVLIKYQDEFLIGWKALLGMISGAVRLLSVFLQSAALGVRGLLNWMKLVASFYQVLLRIAEASNPIPWMRDRFREGIDALEGFKTGLDNAGKSSDILGTGLGELGFKMEEATVTTKDLGTAIDNARQQYEDFLAPQRNLDEIMLQNNDRMRQLTEQVKENGAWLKWNTEAGDANRRTIMDITGGLLEQYWAELKAGTGVAEATKKLQERKTALVDDLVQMGFNRDRAQQLVDKYAEIPSDVLTQIQVQGADAAIGKIQDLNSALYGVSKIWGFAVPQGKDPLSRRQRARGFASGGAIFGPGTATSDSIPARLSDGEFVIKTASAQRLGYDKLDYMNNYGRVPGFATGGRVAAASGGLVVNFNSGVLGQMVASARAVVAQAVQIVTNGARQMAAAFNQSLSALGRTVSVGLGTVVRTITTAMGVIARTFQSAFANWNRLAVANYSSMNRATQSGLSTMVRTIASASNNMTRGWDSTWKTMARIIVQGLNNSRASVAQGMNGIINILNNAIRNVNAVLAKLGVSGRIPAIGGVSSGVTGRRGGGGSFATGGYVTGPGGPTDDKIPAWLSNQEYVIKASTVKNLGVSTFDYINETGRLPMATGGPVYKQMMAWAKQSLPGVRFSSTLRPGDPGYHGRGQAVDMVFSDGSERRGNGQARFAFNRIKSTFMRGIAELIWDFARGSAVWNGRNHFFTGPSAGPGTHNDHIHWAMASGKGLDALAFLTWEEVEKKFVNPALAKFSQGHPNNGMGFLGRGMGGFMAKQIRPWIKKEYEKMQAELMASLSSSDPGDGGAGVQRWGSVVAAVLKELGVYSAGNVQKVLASIGQESGGNPRAINRSDSNAARGTPSKGLNQVIDPTFNAYAGKYRSRGVWDPYANIYASVRYALSRYGSRGLDVMAAPGGYDSGGWLMPGMTMAYNGTGQPEAVLTNTQWDDISKAVKSEADIFDIDVFIHEDYIETVLKKHGQEVARKFKAGRKVFR